MLLELRILIDVAAVLRYYVRLTLQGDIFKMKWLLSFLYTKVFSWFYYDTKRCFHLIRDFYLLLVLVLLFLLKLQVDLTGACLSDCYFDHCSILHIPYMRCRQTISERNGIVIPVMESGTVLCQVDPRNHSTNVSFPNK